MLPLSERLRGSHRPSVHPVRWHSRGESASDVGDHSNQFKRALNRASLLSEAIVYMVFCRLRYRLTLRDLSEIMLLRGFTVSRECIRRWEAKLLPVIGDALRKRRQCRGLRSGKSCTR
jgi:transposase-like protein